MLQLPSVEGFHSRIQCIFFSCRSNEVCHYLRLWCNWGLCFRVNMVINDILMYLFFYIDMLTYINVFFLLMNDILWQLIMLVGKFVVAYVPLCQEKEYYLACAWEEIYAPSSAYFSLFGLTVQASFLRGKLIFLIFFSLHFYKFD